MIRKRDARFSRLLNAARLHLRSEAKRHADAQSDEKKRIAAEEADRRQKLELEAVSAREERLRQRAVRDAAASVLLRFVRGLRGQSNHIRVDGDEGDDAKQLRVSVSYGDRKEQVIRVVHESIFTIASEAGKAHVGVTLKPRRIFSNVEKLSSFLEDDFLVEIAQSVALAEAAKATRKAVGTKAGKQRETIENTSIHSGSAKPESKKYFERNSLAKLRSMERSMGMVLSSAKKQRSR